MKIYLRVFLLLCLALRGGMAQAAEPSGEASVLDDSFYEDTPNEDTVPDPFEHFNRLMFKFNDVTYTWVMEPVASAYSQTVPEDIRQVTDNFFYNLQEPIRFVNALLQFRFSDAGTVLTRFAINTVGGIGGLADPAGHDLGFKPVDASLGETLEFWGVQDGAYLVMPVLGATTMRELFGTTVDGLSMTPYYFWADSWREGTLIYMGRRVNNLSLRLGEYEGLKELTIDPYKALRDSYFQYRKQARKHSTPSADEKL
jgi:phospholipid-binding lipoprotein MlaA